MRSVAKGIVGGVLSFGLSLSLTGCGTQTTGPAPTSGNGSTGVTTNVVVAVTPTATQVVDAGQSVTLTATVTGDSTNKGVVWTLPAGGGTLSTSTALTTTYTAPAASLASVTVTATSVFDPTKSAAATVAVNPLPGFSSTGQLGQGYLNLPYTATVGATGGTGAKIFALASGSTLPAGLTLNASTGVISGTPTANGSTTFSLTVTDSAASPLTAVGSFSIGVSQLQLNVPVATLPGGVQNKAYPTETYTSAFGIGAVTYTVASGSLPTGITLTPGGVLSGTPTGSGTSNFTITATDTKGQTASATGSIAIAPVLTFGSATPTSGQAGDTYSSATATATGGTGAYTFSVAPGTALPKGLTLSNAGTHGNIAGTPTVPGNYTFGITVTDSGIAGSTQQSVTANYSLNVTAAPLSITNTTLPNGIPGSPYQQALAASGGVGPYSYSLDSSSGPLPPGLFLTTSGMLTGKPTATGIYPIRVTVADSIGTTPTVPYQTLSIDITSSLTPGVNNSELNGSYAFVFNGQSNASFQPSAMGVGSVYGQDMAGSLKFDGTTGVTGTIDINSAYTGVSTSVSVTGSYSVGADNRGEIVLKYSPGTVLTLDIAVSGVTGGVASKFRLIEADSNNPIDPTGVQGAGEALLQVPTDFSAISKLTGGYVFRLNGETPSASALAALSVTVPGADQQFGAISAAGYMLLNGAGLVVHGTQDATTNGVNYPLVSITGTYSAPDPATGRGTMSITTIGNSYPAAPANFVYYVASANRLMLLSTDPHSTLSLAAGEAYKQQQTLYNSASLSGTVILSGNAVSGGDGVSTYQNQQISQFWLLATNAAGNTTASQIVNYAGGPAQYPRVGTAPTNLTYTVSDQGRVVFSNFPCPVPSCNPAATFTLPVMWLYDANEGVGSATYASPQQLVGTFSLDGLSTSNIDGTYSIGTEPSMLPVNYTSGNVGIVGKVATFAEDTSNQGILTSDSTRVQNISGGGGNIVFGTGSSNPFWYGFSLTSGRLVYMNIFNNYLTPSIVWAEK